MTQPAPSVERRHEPRVQALDLVHVARHEFPPPTLGFETDDAIGRTLDLSHDGLRLQLDHPLPLRSRVRLDLALGNAVLRLDGTVRSARVVDDRACEMGIAFEPTPEQWEALDAYLRLRAAS